MSKDACAYLEELARKQHGMWLAMLYWLIAVIAYVVVITTFFKNVPDAVVEVPFYASALLIYIPIHKIYKLRCPHCHGPAGALAFLRYKFLLCKSCGKRIECGVS